MGKNVVSDEEGKPSIFILILDKTTLKKLSEFLTLVAVGFEKQMSSRSKTSTRGNTSMVTEVVVISMTMKRMKKTVLSLGFFLFFEKGFQSLRIMVLFVCLLGE